MKSIEIKNLVKKFEGVHAIDGLSLKIPEGRITGLVGPNGSGKTTLINALSGLFPTDGGTIVAGGVRLESIRSSDVSSYGITRTFQGIRLFEQMTVLDNLLVVLTERNVFGALFEKHTALHVATAEEILKKLNIWEKRSELACNLSYGQRKLLEIGRALAMKSDVYLFDEPFAGLFPEIMKIVTNVLKELRDERKTIILVEHDMAIIRELCDYVFVLDSGKLLAEGAPHEVLGKKEVVEAYLGL